MSPAIARPSPVDAVRVVMAALRGATRAIVWRLAEVPHRSVVLSRDGIQIGMVESGGDPTQDGCAFQVNDAEALFAEFRANGLEKELSKFDIENRKDGSSWKVFYVVAPDGLCYWFGERGSNT